MEIADKVIIVTGGGNGIGKALCERFHQGGARKVIVADLEENSAKAVAATVDGDAYAVDVRDETQIQAMVSEVEERHGQVDQRIGEQCCQDQQADDDAPVLRYQQPGFDVVLASDKGQFLGRGLAAEDFVAVGEAAESGDDGLVLPCVVEPVRVRSG